MYNSLIDMISVFTPCLVWSALWCWIFAGLIRHEGAAIGWLAGTTVSLLWLAIGPEHRLWSDVALGVAGILTGGIAVIALARLQARRSQRRAPATVPARVCRCSGFSCRGGGWGCDNGGF